MNAAQLSQEEALRALVDHKILERNRPPPVRSIQVIAAEGAEKTIIFVMLRDPAVAGIENLDAWEITGPLRARKAVQAVLQNQISKRYAQ